MKEEYEKLNNEDVGLKEEFRLLANKVIESLQTNDEEKTILNERTEE
jgi:hypothetical protein